MEQKNNEAVKPALSKAIKTLEGSKVDPKKKKLIAQERIDMYRMFVKTFSTISGKAVLEELRRISKNGHPDYLNVNHQYAKIGQQELIQHIENVMAAAKREK